MNNTRFTLLFVCITFNLVAFTKANLNIVTRMEWRSRKARQILPRLVLPTPRVIIIHAGYWECHNYEDCLEKVRNIQRYHMFNTFIDDIGYNFLIDGEGIIYEGRGWDHEGNFAKGFNAGSLGIALIGNYDKSEPTEESLDALRHLIARGIELGKISNNYRLYGHCQVSETHSPGAKLFRIIKEWPHWSATIFNN